MTPWRQLDLSQVRVLDGGLATELEFLGADISGPLWSAHVLENAPDKIKAVHRAYIEAGADCIETASYQVSTKGYLEYGLSKEAANKALLRSVSIAEKARAAFPERQILVAASLGPYGAALHNGAEYHGNYDCSHQELVLFHRERIEVLEKSSADLFAFETVPSLDEAYAIVEALQAFPDLGAWISFTCRDEHSIAHGESLKECALFLEQIPQVLAIGVNCTQPSLLPSLIREIRAASGKRIFVYPNSGEGWDAERRVWQGSSDPQIFHELAKQWLYEGAQAIGGCCRTRPEHIRQIRMAIQ